MSNLAIIFSDLHVHAYKQFNENGRRLKNGIAFLDYIFKMANANDIKYIFMPGDLHNLMQIVSVKAVNAVVKCLKANFELYPNITLVAVSGNHDYSEVNLLDRPAESALEHLNEIFSNFMLLDNGCMSFGNIKIHGLPYYEHAEHFRVTLEKTQNKIDNTMVNILLMHQTVASGLPIEDDIQPDDYLFKNFSMIFNGHIHNCEQITEKFINVGSPIHRDAGDIGKQKGFWVVDLNNPTETISFKDITDKFPQFIHKTVGEELTEWESQQYVIWVLNTTTENVSEVELSEKFSTNLDPSIILTNYCKEVVKEDDLRITLSYGLNLLT